MIRLSPGESLLKAPRTFRCCVSLQEGFQDFRTSHCGEAIGSTRVLQGTRGEHWPLRCLTRGYSLRDCLQQRRSKVKSYALVFIALTACAQQRPVQLAPVQMDTLAGDPSAAALRPRPVFDTQRDDPFATTNRID